LDQMKGFAGGAVVGTGDPGDGSGPIGAGGDVADSAWRRRRKSKHKGEGNDTKGPTMIAKETHKYESGH
jgi:hypothetical protein